MSKKLGYEPAPHGDGKSEKFKLKGSENKRGNAPRQDGGNSKKAGEQAHDCLWDQDMSEGGDNY